MGLISWANERIKRLDIWDIGSIKWGSIFIGIIIGAYIANWVKQYIWIHIALAIALLIRPIYRYFRK